MPKILVTMTLIGFLASLITIYQFLLPNEVTAIEPIQEENTNPAILGRWIQTESTAGKCAACTLNIRQGTRERLIISSNTKWKGDFSLSGSTLIGEIVWDNNISGPYAGQRMSASIEVIRERLTLIASGSDNLYFNARFER